MWDQCVVVVVVLVSGIPAWVGMSATLLVLVMLELPHVGYLVCCRRCQFKLCCAFQSAWIESML